MADHDYEPGKMDISEQEKTFNGFISLSIKTAAVCIGVLIFLALVNA
ncbi:MULTISPECIES: aa3-type cytochrome c oxidase subunit IV [unclassified Yoonia]|nr:MULTISPECIES: aa3-type cytochrome c oxidase subunit IV [unclassified Yoonia]